MGYPYYGGSQHCGQAGQGHGDLLGGILVVLQLAGLVGDVDCMSKCPWPERLKRMVRGLPSCLASSAS